MAIAHGPAQVAFTLANLVEGVEVKAQLAEVGIPLLEVAAHGRQTAHFMQWIAEQGVFAVELAHAIDRARDVGPLGEDEQEPLLLGDRRAQAGRDLERGPRARRVARDEERPAAGQGGRRVVRRGGGPPGGLGRPPQLEERPGLEPDPLRPLREAAGGTTCRFVPPPDRAFADPELSIP